MPVEGVRGVAHGLKPVARSGRQREPSLSEITPGASGEEKTGKSAATARVAKRAILELPRVVGEFAMAPMVGYRDGGHMRGR